MKHLAAYLLLGLGGNTSPSAADVKAVLESVGIEADSERLTTLISELKGKDLNEVRTLDPRLTGGRYLTMRSSSLRALPSWLPSHLVEAVVAHQLLVVPLLAVLPPLRRRSRRRRKVRKPGCRAIHDTLLTRYTEKEESDEDMGFGLFD